MAYPFQNDDFSNLKNLNNQGMLATTSDWGTPGSEAYIALSSAPTVSGLLPQMIMAREGLLNLGITDDPGPNSEILKQLADEAGNLDGLHDRLLQAVYRVADAHRFVVTDEQVKAAIEAMLKRLFSKGLWGVNATFLEESGETEWSKQRITDADRDLLSRIPTMEGNLLSLAEQWFEAGNALGEVERRRAQLAEQHTGASVSTVSQVRNYWIRVVRAILAGLELAENIDDETMTAILQPLRNAVEKARKQND